MSGTLGMRWWREQKTLAWGPPQGVMLLLRELLGLTRGGICFVELGYILVASSLFGNFILLGRNRK